MCVKSSERQMMKVMDLILLLVEEILHELQVSLKRIARLLVFERRRPLGRKRTGAECKPGLEQAHVSLW